MIWRDEFRTLWRSEAGREIDALLHDAEIAELGDLAARPDKAVAARVTGAVEPQPIDPHALVVPEGRASWSISPEWLVIGVSLPVVRGISLVKTWEQVRHLTHWTPRDRAMVEDLLSVIGYMLDQVVDGERGERA